MNELFVGDVMTYIILRSGQERILNTNSRA